MASAPLRSSARPSRGLQVLILFAVAVAGLLGAATPALAVTATTNQPSDLTASTATLNGTIDPQGQAGAYRFVYGTSAGYGQATEFKGFPAGSSPVQVSEAISGLNPSTTYHVRVETLNGAPPNQTATTGNDVTFATLSPTDPTGTPGVAATQPARSVGTTSATLHGTVNPQGQDAFYAFGYGTTTDYGRRTPGHPVQGSQPIAVSEAISGLQPGTTYHFRLYVVRGSYPNQSLSSGADVTFTTQPSQAPYKPPAKPKPKPKKPAAKKRSRYGVAVLAGRSFRLQVTAIPVRLRCRGARGALCRGRISLSMVVRKPGGRPQTVACGTARYAATAPHLHVVIVRPPAPLLCDQVIGILGKYPVDLRATFTSHQKPLRARILVRF